MAGRLDFTPTPISGVFVLQRTQVADARGYLERLYDEHDVVGNIGPLQVNQVNRTFTLSAGTVRGLHLQLPPHAETKIVSCLKGKVFDVAVDLRADSPTYLKWMGCELSPENCRALIIPEGCAHGIQTLVDECELLYLHSSPHVPTSEAGLHPLDPEVGVKWPLPIGNISHRDTTEWRGAAYFQGVVW